MSSPLYTEPIDDPLTGADTFDSGVPVLDDWLRSTAVTMERAGLGRTHVWRDRDGLVIAYFTLSPHQVAQDGVPSRDRYSKASRPVPGYLLGKLALDKSLHGRRLGTRLLTQALERVADAAQLAAGRLLVVDDIDDNAAGFYRAHGFRDIRRDDPTRPQRLYRRVSDILADVSPGPGDGATASG
ncbi:GNAT family N-acetyltransferase [Streptomyces sp. NPDC092296]|uniref:GNAT family N-acetyltransferase n=1 Tax=Streptomyces sp. NPDC092296 TaxID=3366012 RepID=UPI00380C0948